MNLRSDAESRTRAGVMSGVTSGVMSGVRIRATRRRSRSMSSAPDRSISRVGADVGGTHTDLVLADGETGQICVNKVPTIVGDSERATVQGLHELVRAVDVALDAVDCFMHGTTIDTKITSFANRLY